MFQVRYVAFDKLGHKLITGISNSPHARWERVRAPVPVPRQIDRTANTYRRRITPRLIYPQLSFQQVKYFIWKIFVCYETAFRPKLEQLQRANHYQVYQKEREE